MNLSLAEFALAVGHATVTTAAAAAIGTRLRWCDVPVWHGALQWATRVAMGMSVIAAVVYGLVAAGVATPNNLRVLFLLLATLAALHVVATWRDARPRTSAPRGAAANRARLAVSDRIAIGLAVVYAAWMLACAMLPPTAVDELNHHLAVPRTVLSTGRFPVFHDNIYAYFPPLGEMLFLFGLGAAGELAARLVHASFGVMLAAAVFGFSRRYVARTGAIYAVAILLSVPTVMVILPWAYVDLIFTVYAFLAIAFVIEHLDDRRLRWAALGGVMAGLALATKYTGIQLVMLLALVLLVEHLMHRRRGIPIPPVVVIAAAAPIAGAILWRNWALTGWPLYPFPLGPLPIHDEFNWDSERAAMFLTLLATYGSSASPAAPASLTDALRAPFLVFLTAAFDDPHRYDGVVGPIFLLIPLAWWRGAYRHDLRWLVGLAVVFVLYWALTIRQVRFLIPIIPVMSVLLAVAVARSSRLFAVAVAAAVAVSAGTATARVLARDPISFWTGAESRDDYLRRRVPGYAAYEMANRRLEPTDQLYLVNMRNYGYYLHVGWRADFVFEQYAIEQALAAPDPARAIDALVTRRGTTHFLIDERSTFGDAALTARQQATLRAWLDRQATLVERVDGRSLYALRASDGVTP